MSILMNVGGLTILTSVIVFLLIILILVIVILVAKQKLIPSGNVKININDDPEKELEVAQGGTLLNSLQSKDIYLSSACGGKGTCGECRCRVVSGGGEILPTEKGHFTRKEQMNNWRLSCQVKVKDDLSIVLPEEIFGIKEWECEVISNRNVASFIKEFVVKLPEGETIDFKPGSYSQIRVPKFDAIKYSDFDIDEKFKPEWDKFKMWDLVCKSDEDTSRAYSMANFPAEGNIITLNVRVATPPFDRAKGTWMNVNPGIVSSYIFNLKPGDKVMMSGPYGEFHPILDSKREMLWIGGGAGMAPLRSQIMHLLKTLRITDRKMSFFYGARALIEAFYLEDFYELEREFPNFSFHLALDRPDPKADEAGIKYTPGFVHQVIYDTYLKDHDAPEDIEYYMCGPGPMANAAQRMLDSLGVPKEMIMFDDFG
ncbi:MAG TPA: NADH:ubiquinone reductase (Na(+)-transporting) subunit F [Fermentimonas caenicola]|jgi:Na+-transporting NADH:ubiquinone oxidoreductase subunit F|uniref:Na(+)-translocating NADH-quinone reductase subunit F n=1 Tax=Fermentimonas caenicola TaxID=1562970 RepID=A0A098C0Q1_9BACT|nr:NADH:ubiquinone reductase (Na(+)-transporting) subunit F [Lascolabacillus sp.]MBP6176188.1 NADH:ubiquinone reductase (Na(+)-transporting) subunit F [Fermentimonas sp.]MDI9626120.1 NADH:ubiquinone reductase (Na(+)-transporting) subunit F [Bacteroidota bacterium]TAH61646.1 MAG: NADH:ubiquinone reductase (Na(+)-transporting) subunit F [Fermentimonas caenicola]MBP6197522.1 NADH:ubiquinone reductase (Na(+)-transporting) subunit F [Fermentimonas sp.]MBP7103847.1 NADH:ubiquinone reductase (Na(+)-t